MGDGTAPEQIHDLLRELAPQVLGALMRRYRDDFGAAEDAVQEALLAAATHWPRAGLPDNPRGWLIEVAFRRMTDQRRSEVARRRREDAVAAEIEREQQGSPPGPPDGGGGDDTLLLLFMCCHPALTPASAIALTLRAVGGLTTGEIAKAFLVPETTMAQRISRAKATIKSSGIDFEPPSPAEWPPRLAAVLQVLYLVFNEGYTSSAGAELQRHDLTAEAIRLARLLHQIQPHDPEVAGLLALMLLTDARRDARCGAGGELIPLDEQDRSRWDRAAIAEGTALVTAAFARGAVGPYQVQAAIAALHDDAPTVAATDWGEILALYRLLERMSDNPVVRLNRIVAEAMVRGPAAGLEQLRALEGDPRLAGNHRLDAVRAHLLERSGDLAAAAAAYRLAAERTDSLPERAYLLSRAARLAGA